MGCTASVLPDGDGIETLPWLANDDIRVHADFRHVLLGGDLQPTQRHCRILINQEAIWKKLSGGAVETLPYPADDSSEKAADFKHVLLGGDLQPTQRDCRILINQEAIWKKLSGGAVETLPYPADDSSKKAATFIRQNLHISSCILVNQEALWHKLCGQHDIALPHPPSDSCKTWAGLVNQSISRPCRIWMNQEAMFNKLSR
jgi:hypothetical protein